MALVRRLIALFEGKDLPAPVFAARLGKDKKAVYRYERGEHKPPGDIVDKIVEMCVAAGLPMITAEWIERGRGGTAALGDLRIPEIVLDTNMVLAPASRPADPRARGKLVTTARTPRKKEAS